MSNKIEKQKGVLIGVGIALLVISLAFLAGGIPLLVLGIGQTSAVKIVFGAILSILFIPTGIVGFYVLWMGSYLTATKGSIKEGNIAKEGGTVNMVKCDKCGTEIKAGETVCSNCGKPVNNTNSPENM